ncbi:MAG: DUF4143 domain-containing protein [Defluviitaleaceae bacterium]|nr:DUF4143 domain-containing protein [Defluviitaleaceae bacterium]
MKYHPRFADNILSDRLKGSGAVLIEGAKGCGKTETATQAAKSVARFDIDEQIHIKMEVDPKSVLNGYTPRLLDEWQEHPKIWNYIRHEVDERKMKGQFILTGSATPDDSVRRHSGAGRFSVIKMRPMSLYEKEWSSGEVALADLMSGAVPRSETASFEIGEFAEKMMLGGWPGTLGVSSADGMRFSQDYISLIAEADMSRVSDKKRDPYKITRLLRSLARNVSTEVTLAALAKDTAGSDADLDGETVRDYLSVMERLMVVDNIPAWSTHIRSADTLRKSSKRYFADPSLAVGALGLGVDKLLDDLCFYGLLFESLVIRDLKIYSDVNDGKLFHYRDSRGMEIDAIVEYPDGAWGAFEIKLGMGAADTAAENLLRFAAKVDTEKIKPPSALTVITGNGFAHRRADGVNVVPVSVLTA